MIEPAALRWRNGQPYSETFADIYHDPDGSGEVERVFLAPARLDELLADRRRLLVGELGFGTGLNFAVLARHCLARGVQLHFVSVEAAPIAPEGFRELARNRRASEPLYAELAEVYPPLLHGWHRRSLAGGGITLTVYWGDAQSGLTELAAGQRRPFDLWLLDGFAPDRNPAMWSPALFGKIAATAHRGTRVTTFTAAGRVRRALAEVGFRMRRVDQRPHKRESLAGEFEPEGLPAVALPARVTVAGAGIAGAAIARELAVAGVDVVVLEAAPTTATGTSSIPATLMHPRLLHDGSPLATLKATTYAHALAAVRPYLAAAGQTGAATTAASAESDPVVRRTGALQVASATYPADKLAAVAERYRRTGIELTLCTPAEASRLTGVNIETPALWFPEVCQVDTPGLTRRLLDHPRILLRTGTVLDAWPDHPAILACGANARHFPEAAYLELGEMHGQLDRVRVEWPTAMGLRVPVTGNGYVVPGGSDPASVHVGATYEYAPWAVERASEQNLGHLLRLGAASMQTVDRYRASRCIASDRQPVLGALHDLEGRALPHALVSVGHGSTGTVSAHLGAALLSAGLSGDLPPLAGPLAALVSPLRFRQRQARRGYRFGARA